MAAFSQSNKRFVVGYLTFRRISQGAPAPDGRARSFHRMNRSIGRIQGRARRFGLADRFKPGRQAAGGFPTGACYCSRTTTESVAPFASITETRAKPAPSGRHAGLPARIWLADRRAIDEPGERRRAAQRLQRKHGVADALGQGRGRPARHRAETRSSAPGSRWRPGSSARPCANGAAAAAGRRWSRPRARPWARGSTRCRARVCAKASNRIGAAAWRPISPGAGALSGRPTQTAIVEPWSKPIASASRKP